LILFYRSGVDINICNNKNALPLYYLLYPNSRNTFINPLASMTLLAYRVSITDVSNTSNTLLYIAIVNLYSTNIVSYFLEDYADYA
jgi:hypothetical protein